MTTSHPLYTLVDDANAELMIRRSQIIVLDDEVRELLARATRAERERDELRDALAGFVRDWNAGRPLDTSVDMARALLDRLAVRS